MLLAITMAVAACSIVYELVLAQTLAVLMGNTVLRYSMTIGCYLGALGVGAMLCQRSDIDLGRRLFRVELALSVVGGLSVAATFLIDALHRHWYVVEQGEGSVVPYLALGATHAVIVAIGVLSGFEIPLLMRLGERMRPGSTNVVLGVDYLGALVGSVLFPTVLLREAGLLGTAFVVALVNALVAVAVVGWLPMRGPRRRGLAAMAAAILLGVAWSRADEIELHFARKYYGAARQENIGDLVSTRKGDPKVERIHSPYQTIDIVREPDRDQWFTDLLSHRRRKDGPRDLWLYLSGDFQVFSGSEEFYHEWFVHVPVQTRGTAPRRALVLGGGDGATLRELLKYPDLAELVQVELDPEMLALARTDHDFRRINGNAHDDPRVEVARADAMSWLRGDDRRFDAVFIDMPYARDETLSIVYSREFYALVRRHLTEDGFVAIDTPGGECWEEGNDWAIYSSTLLAAGFRSLLAVSSRVPTYDDRLHALVERTKVYTVAGRNGPITYRGDGAKEALAQVLYDAWENLPEHFFMVAYPESAPELPPHWTEFDIRLDALRPHLLVEAFPACDQVYDPRKVNSIFRPTLPELAFDLLATR